MLDLKTRTGQPAITELPPKPVIGAAAAKGSFVRILLKKSVDWRADP
jgi:hypothetical protein